MKRYLYIVLLSFVISPISLMLCQQSTLPIQQPETSGPFGGVPQLSDKEMEALNEWAKVLEGFSEEELEELANIGEMYMKELEQQGIDPMEFLFHEDSPIWEKPPVLEPEPQPAEPTKESLSTPEQPGTITEKDNTSKILSVSDKEKIKALQHTLEDIADKIGSLRQKGESKISLSEKLQLFELALSDLTYFVLTLKEDHLVKYLLEPKYESLYRLINELHQALEIYEPQVYVAEFSLEGKDPYTILGIRSSDSFETIYKQYQTLSREENPFSVEARLKEQGVSPEDRELQMEKARNHWNKVLWAYEALQAKENSKYAFESLLNILQQVLYKQDIIAKFKEILRAYDPEALKMKEEQERKEKKAREDQERLARQRPPWTQPVFTAPSSRDYRYDSTPDYSWATAPSYAQPYVSSNTSPSGYGASAQAEKTPQEGKKPSRGRGKPSESEKEGDEASEKPTKTPLKSNKDKIKTSEPSEKKKKKDLPLSETDRKIFRAEDALDSLQQELIEQKPIILGIKSYLAKPYDVTDRAIAIQVNQLLTSLTEEFDTLHKTMEQDLESLKNKQHNKEKYIKQVGKAVKAFKDDEKIKNTLETVKGFATQEDTITFKGEIIPSDPTKRFLVAGMPLPLNLQQDPIAQELQTIHNPLANFGAAQSTMNHINNLKKAYDSFEKFIKDSLKLENNS